VFDRVKLAPLSNALEAMIQNLDGVQLVGSREARLANTISFLVSGSDSIALLAGLDLEGICASSGSACSAGSLEPSHVIVGLGIDPKLANSLVRFSLGRETTPEEIRYAEKVVPEVIKRAQLCQ
jgi:cysteine desulfurase